MIRVAIPVTIGSTKGALVTVVAGVAGYHRESAEAAPDVVSVEASGVVFGKTRRGFTLVGGQVGLSVSETATDVSLGGNLTVRNLSGIDSRGRGREIRGNILMANHHHGLLRSGENVQILANVAIANGGWGFFALSDSITLAGNLASANNVGLRFSLLHDKPAPPTTENAAIANFAEGVQYGAVLSSLMPIAASRRSIIGNGGQAVFLGLPGRRRRGDPEEQRLR